MKKKQAQKAWWILWKIEKRLEEHGDKELKDFEVEYITSYITGEYTGNISIKFRTNYKDSDSPHTDTRGFLIIGPRGGLKAGYKATGTTNQKELKYGDEYLVATWV